MKYLKNEFLRDIDSADEVQESSFLLEARLAELRQHRAELADDREVEAASLLLEEARLLIRLEKMTEAWDTARQALDVFLSTAQWEKAAEACDALFACEQEDSLAALGQGIWLSVTFPMDPELTVSLLNHVIDETPNDSDGAAVAAIVAHYVADLRAEGRQRDDLLFYTNNLLGTVARRHSNVQSQEAFDFWVQKLELTDPAKFLVRLRNVIDVLVQDKWWFDRDALQAKLPVN
ncbi:MAG: hypothetical protein OEV31_02865 [Gammaproteobacteria bacterium]|nr:hypothetical protein [Gammaproteobacteria bacterium]